MFAQWLGFTLLAAFVTSAFPVAAQVQPPPGVMALAVGDTPGTGDAEWVANGQGLGDLLINDIGQLIQATGSDTDCKAMQVEWRRRGDAIREQELQQSRFVDPATRVRTGQMIEPNVMITGTSNLGNGTLSYTFEMRSHPDGTLIGTVSGEFDFDATSARAPEIAEKIVEKLCKKGWTASGGGPRITITGTVKSITASFELGGVFPDGTALFTYAPSGPAGGTVTYSASGSGVTAAGTGTYTMTDNGDGSYTLSQTTGGCVHGIPNSCKENSEVMALTPVN